MTHGLSWIQGDVPDLIEFTDKSGHIQAQTCVSQDSSLRHSSHFINKKPETLVLGLVGERSRTNL